MGSVINYNDNEFNKEELVFLVNIFTIMLNE